MFLLYVKLFKGLVGVRNCTVILWSLSKFFLVLLLQGHRLKNLESQTYLALDKLKTTKRILLSGTISNLPVTPLVLGLG